MRYITGNENLLKPEVKLFTYPHIKPKGEYYSPKELDQVEKVIEEAVFSACVIVVRSSWPPELARRVAIVPLRWGSPRMIVNEDIRGYGWQKLIEAGDEFFRVCRLWRYKWDGKTDVLVKPDLKRHKADA